MKLNKEYLGIFFILTLIVSYLFYDFILGEIIFVSGDTLAPQAIKQAINNLKIDNGTFPNWFPYIYSGMPTVHSFLSISDYYFPHKIMQILEYYGLPWIWNFLFHYIFAGFGMYALLRFLKQTKFVSIFGSILFSTSPYMVVYLVHGHGSQIMTASYIPWIILFLFKIYDNMTIINFIILSLIIGLQLQRGHIQIAYYTWMMVGLFITIRFFIFLKNKKYDNKKIKIFCYKNLYVFISLFLGFLSSLSVYLPVINYSSISTRGSANGGFGIDNATQWSLNIKELITFILPYSYGFGGKNYWGYLPFTDFPNYIGILVIFLALIGLIQSHIRKEYKIFFLLAIIFSLFISFGKYFITFYSIFYNWFPFFDKFRAPIFILIIFQFSIYVMAACGLSRIPELIRDRTKIKYIYSCLSIFIILLIINSYIPSKLYPYERFNGKENEFFNQLEKTYSQLLINKDLNNDNIYNNSDKYILNQWTNSDAKLYYSYLKFINTKQTSSELINILNNTNIEVENNIKYLLYDSYYIIGMLILVILSFFLFIRYDLKQDKYLIYFIMLLVLMNYLRVNKDIINPTYHVPNKIVTQNSIYLDNFLENDQVINFLEKDDTKFRILDYTGNNSNRWAAFNIETIYGYHAAKLDLYNKLLTQVRNKGYYPKGLLQMLNVKYIIHNQRGDIPFFTVKDNKYKMNYFYSNPDELKTIETYIYENNKFIDRIFITKEINLVDNDDEILDKIISDSFNPTLKSYINLNYLTDEQLLLVKDIQESNNSSVEIIEWKPDKIEFITKTDKSQMILLSEIYYPGWVIKDENIEIIRINGLFRGIIVPKGENIYTMEFQPQDIKTGKLISNLSYLILICLFSVAVYRREIV